MKINRRQVDKYLLRVVGSQMAMICCQKTIGVRARSDLGGRRPVCPKKLRSAPLLDCRNQLFTLSKCTKKHAFTIVERHKIVRNRNTVFRTSHTLCRFTRCSNDRVTKQATRSSN